MPIKIVLYEDNTGLREALVILIGGTEGYDIVGAFENCNDIVAQMETLRPEVVLMDIDMPGTNGIEGVRLLKKHHPEIDVLMLTVFDDDDRVLEAILAGANGYLLKKTPPARLLEALQEVKEGGAPMTPMIARKVLTLYATPANQVKQTPPPTTLTDREKEVLETLSKGFSYKMVASELNISIDTVRGHVRHIYEKLQVHSITEAIAITFLRK